MNKKFISAVAAVGLIFAMSSCKDKAASQSDSDSRQIEEAVALAPAAEISDSLAQKYNKAFFDNAALKSETPTDSTWSETSSGLKYAVVKTGEGLTPTAQDIVSVHYIGHLVDGTVFDSSVARGEPAQFPLSGVIPGWTEGLQYMAEGGVAVFYIPYALAYGENGGGPIPPKSDLIFDVQLLQVSPGQ